MSKAIFLDTNVLIHYQDFDQLDWLSIVHSREVVIVVPPITLRELNKLKDLPPRTRINDRAGHIQRKLDKLLITSNKATLRDGIHIMLEDRDPIDEYAKFDLNPNIQDDQLLASMMMYKKINPKIEIALITTDSGLLLIGKARRFEIATIRIPENLKIPEEVDPAQQRLEELEQKVRQYEARIPQLSLIFADQNLHAQFQLSRPVVLADENLLKRVEDIKHKFPKRDLPDGVDERTITLRELRAISPMMIGYTNQDLVSYNLEIEKFYEMYEVFIRRDAEVQNMNNRTVKLTISLKNTGSAPAEDVDVSMHFPDGMHLMEKHELPRKPKEPEPPRLRTVSDRLSDMLRLPVSALSARTPPPLPLPPSNVSSPTIKRTNSYEVEIHIRRIKHKQSVPFDPLYLRFESFDTAQSFTIDYRINAANIPQDIIGKLHVVVNKAAL